MVQGIQYYIIQRLTTITIPIIYDRPAILFIKLYAYRRLRMKIIRTYLYFRTINVQLRTYVQVEISSRTRLKGGLSPLRPPTWVAVHVPLNVNVVNVKRYSII